MNLSERYKLAKVNDVFSQELVDSVYRRLRQNAFTYQSVESRAKIPWPIIAIIHQMESSGNFNAHLHNGDPLSSRTVQVPKGRPHKGIPPFTWQESAIDALSDRPKIDFTDLDAVLDWLTAFNGYGYVPRGINTPYLWSGTDQYTKGKYVSDGKFDPNAVSQQIGAVVFLKLFEEQGLLNFGSKQMSDVTWFEFHRNEQQDPTVIGWAGSSPRVKIQTNKTDDLVAFFAEHRGAKTFSVARSDKAMPELEIEKPKPPEPVKPKDIRKNVVAIALERCSKGRSHKPGNIIDVEVLDPLRPAMKKLGQMGQSDDDSFYNWCASNVTKILRQAGLDVPDQPIINGKPFWATVALVETWKAWAISKGAWRNSRSAQLGDIVIYDWDGNGVTDHIGIITELRSSGVVAAEGNKNNREAIIYRDRSTFAGTINIERLF
jgi:lysozyme family protein